MRNRIFKAPLAAAIGLVAALAIPAAAQAHTATAARTCTTTTLTLTSFASSGDGNGGKNQVNYTVETNGASVAAATATFTGSGTVVEVPNRLYDGDVVKVTASWTSGMTRDGHASSYSNTFPAIADCGTKPPPVYDCDGNPLPPGSTPPTPEECNPPTPPTPPVTPPTPPTTPPTTPPATPPTAPPATPPSGGVLPDQVVSGRASLRGPSGCVKQAFRARVNGRSIESVTFYMDGKRMKQVTSGSASLRINPKKIGFGRHRIIALVRFTEASGTPSRRLPLTFRRCARQVVNPQFTG